MHHNSRTSIVAVAISFTLFGLTPVALAEDEQIQIAVDYVPCAEQVGLVATNAMLSDVLRTLAAELQFELHFKSDNDRPISADLRERPSELIKKIGRDDNIMIANGVDARCDEAVDRLDTVWFLGSGPEFVYQPPKTQATEQLVATDEYDAQIRRENKAARDAKYQKYREEQVKSRAEMTPEERYLDSLKRKEARGKL